jgi:dTDP-glucose 4,6-dehydratase
MVDDPRPGSGRAAAGAGLARSGRYLVTGGAGFIGSHFARMTLEAFPEARVTVLDKLTYAGNPDNIADLGGNPRFAFVRGDICDPGVVKRLMPETDIVVNFAAETHVDRAIGDPGSFVLTDVYGAYILLEAAREAGVARFVQISTDEVYGEILGDAATEESPLLPRNPYSASKAGGDRLAYSYFATYGMPVIVTRCSNNYGPYQHPEKLVPLFVTNAIEDRPLPVYGTGTNVRDWIHVRDHVRALHAILSTEGLEGQVFNIAGRNEHSVLEITGGILDALKKPRDLIRHVRDRPGHDRRYAIDDSKLRGLTGWAPETEFGAGLRETVSWFLENRAWWERIKSGAFQDYYRRQYGA